MRTELAKLRGSCFVPPAVFVIAQHVGLITAAGIDLELSRTASSTQQRDELGDGKLDFVVTAMDNVVVWNQHGLTARILAQIERTTPLSLFATRDIGALEDLAGATLAVDSFDNGFSILLRHLVQERGLPDVRWVETGGVRERYDALARGEINATLLGAPFDEIARTGGFTPLGRVDTLFSSFPGQGLVIDKGRLAELQPALAPLLAALRSAIAWSAAADSSEGERLLVEAGYPGEAARSAWENRPRELRPSMAGLDLLLTMRRDLDLLPSGVRPSDLWDGRALDAAAHLGRDEAAESPS